MLGWSWPWGDEAIPGVDAAADEADIVSGVAATVGEREPNLITDDLWITELGTLAPLSAPQVAVTSATHAVGMSHPFQRSQDVSAVAVRVGDGGPRAPSTAAAVGASGACVPHPFTLSQDVSLASPRFPQGADVRGADALTGGRTGTSPSAAAAAGVSGRGVRVSVASL